MSISKELPASLNVRLGTMKPRRGKIKGRKIMSWDAIPDCRMEECNCFDRCHVLAERKQHQQTNRCLVMSSYVRGVFEVILGSYPTISEPDLLRVGLHLIPMYRNLCRLHIEELGLRQIVRVNKGGNNVIHPVYDTIRNYILTIDTLWNRLNFDKKYLGKKSTDPGLGMPDVENIMTGDPDYYGELDDEEASEAEASDTK